MQHRDGATGLVSVAPNQWGAQWWRWFHETSAPLSQWLNIASFDTARECQDMKAAIRARGPDPEPPFPPGYVEAWPKADRGSDMNQNMNQSNAQWAARKHAEWLARVKHDQVGWALARCVPTDDPRLKSQVTAQVKTQSERDNRGGHTLSFVLVIVPH